MSNELYKKVNYLVDIPLMINANIVEYDISKANISMMLSYGIITQYEFDRYAAMDKMTREISIGRMEKSDSGELTQSGLKIKTCISDGIKRAKQLLIERNNIAEESIVRIANDAIFVNNVYLKYTDFDLNNNGVIISFKQKNQYNIMINLERVTIFINDNPMSNTIDVEVKGINDNLLYKHQAFLSFIVNTVSDMQRSGKSTALTIFNDFYEQFINMQLPLEYYREFNSDSMYRINGCGYLMDMVSERLRPMISIEYNLQILRKLYSLIIDL